MNRRIEHYREASAPEPNSLVPAASAVIEDQEGRILLQKRSDNGFWALPGGTMQLGESIPQAAVREVREETGLTVAITGLVGIYTDPEHVIEYSDGEVRQQFNICLTAEIVGGALGISSESTDVRFVSAAELDLLPIHPSTRLRLEHYLERLPRPYVG